jgi:Zn-dependent membrane protease YugP
MFWIVIFLLALLLLVGPQFWTQRILKKYSAPRNDFPGTGGELAQHLIDKYQLNVKLETTPAGDHYDPQTKTVRLLEQNFNGKSLTAVATAAHEVGHAIQHHQGMKLLLARTPLAKFAFVVERLAQIALISAPVFLSFIPAAGRLALLVAVIGMIASTIVHLVTLPVEFDASFGKALPILKEGEYINADDHKAAKRILLACALTYVSAALASLLNIWRWLKFLRR